MTRTVPRKGARVAAALRMVRSGVPSGYSVPGMISPSLKPGRCCGWNTTRPPSADPGSFVDAPQAVRGCVPAVEDWAQRSSGR